MKRISFILILLCTTALKTYSQEAQKVYPFSREQHPYEWYEQQADAWKKVLDKDPKNGLAWYYYYYANRDMAFQDYEGKKMSRAERKAFLDKLIVDLDKNIPDTYENHLIKWMIAGMDTEKLPELYKAVELGPDRTEHIDYLINMAEIDGNTKDKYVYAKKKYDAGQFSSGMLNYNYNVLMGLEPNAIIITCGDNDTYPAWMLQARGIREDVHVLNLSLMLIDSYRERLSKELGFKNFKVDWESKNTVDTFNRQIISNIISNSKNYPVYLALTAADAWNDNIALQQNLYITGLAYKYSKEPMDNIALLKRNFEQRYALDYVDQHFYDDISEGLVKIINSNYIVPMLKLYDHYKDSGDTQRQEWIAQKLMHLSEGTEWEDKVKKHIAKS